MITIVRRKGEKIVLPTADVEFTIDGIQGDQVRVSVKAPRELPVHREETWIRIQEQEKNRSNACDSS